MYNLIKKGVALFSIVCVTIVTLLYTLENKDYLYGGSTEQFVIDESKLTIQHDLQEIAKEHNIVLARRIIETDNSKGRNNITFEPIGAETLPKGLKQQFNKQLIENTPWNTTYAIVKGKLTNIDVVKILNDKGHKAMPIYSNYKSIVLLELSRIPQILVVFLGLIVSFIALILAEYISELRTFGIRRISGEGKYSIAMKRVGTDTLFLVTVTLVALLMYSVVMYFNNLLSWMSVWVVLKPLLLVAILLIVINFFVSNIFYNILQKQPINLLIKGKSPVHIIFILALVIQTLSTAMLLYSVYGINNINNEMKLLETSKEKWNNYSDLFQLTTIDDGGTISSERYDKFKQLLEKEADLIYRERGEQGGEMNYLPNEHSQSNHLYVNGNFIKNSEIVISDELKQIIATLNDVDKVLLIPKSQEHNK